MEGWWRQMKSIVYNHRNGVKIISPDVIDGISSILNDEHPALAKNSVSTLKTDIWNRMMKIGWSGEYRLDSDSKITISSYMQGVGLCFQTGNAGRVYADLLKLQTLYVKGNITAGIILIPTASTAKELGSNMANYERLVRELPLFSQVITMPIVVIGFDGLEK